MRFAIISVAFIGFFTLHCKFSFCQKKQKEFVLAAYWPPALNTTNYNSGSFNNLDVYNYKKLKDCEFGLIIDGMQFLPQSTTYAPSVIKRYYLALLKKFGLATFIAESRISLFSIPDSTNSNQSMWSFYQNNTALKAAGDLPGLYLGDEPKDPMAFEAIKRWTDIFTKQFPEKFTFINLLPRYAFKTDTSYLAYLNVFSKYSNKISIIAFDHYPFRINPDRTAFFLSSYFYNLELFRNVFKRKNIWATIHSVNNDGNIASATGAQLKFMAFCPIAYGVKGLTYWPYHVYKNTPNLTSAIDEDDKKYSQIKEINTFIKSVVGPVVIRFQNLATLHKSNTFLNAHYPFKPSELIENYKGIVRNVNENEILLGIFGAKKLEGQDEVSYIWIVNKSTNSTLKDVEITLKGDFRNRVKLSVRSVGYRSNIHSHYERVKKVLYNKKTNYSVVTTSSFDPGEGRMLMLLK
ncbi:hypothetical protein [Segetibacter sp.]|jgi:hypothetical protein|uniref:hypothetical protein n=1 Tax=Segetibacter sp. TaxID=2231182 RepID=UPI002627BD05|nr:hypothetical protein [Segetibacter sp.]MCW3079336.1 hypothetical protein [Segetibacter sp.]